MELERRSFSEWLRARSAFRLHEDVSCLPADPLSLGYRTAQVELYHQIAGTQEYNPWRTEPVPIAVADSVDPHPFPFSTRDADLIGGHFLALGHILRTLWTLRPGGGHSILEYGCGTGFTTIMLAASGYKMTAVDINASALQVIDTLAATRGLSVTTFNGEFGGAPECVARFDFILFYEAFHHALDFQSLLLQLHERSGPTEPWYLPASRSSLISPNPGACGSMAPLCGKFVPGGGSSSDSGRISS